MEIVTPLEHNRRLLLVTLKLKDPMRDDASARMVASLVAGTIQRDFRLANRRIETLDMHVTPWWLQVNADLPGYRVRLNVEGSYEMATYGDEVLCLSTGIRTRLMTQEAKLAWT